MQACKHIQMQYFEIWQPNYSRKSVLLKATKVGTHNKIKFTKAPSMGDKFYYVSGKTVKQGKKTSNGTIMCYEIKLDKLEDLEIKSGCHHEI